MNAKQFFDLVADMRTAQKEYFRSRSKDVLKESKSLEAKVDAEIKRAREITLFQEE